MMHYFPKLAAGAVLAALLAGPAGATELEVLSNSWSGGYREAEVTVRDNTLEDGSAIMVQQTDTALAIRSGANDRIDLDIRNKSVSYNKLEATIEDNYLSGGSTIAIQQGSFGLITY